MHLHLKSNVLSHQLLFSPTQMEKSPVLCLLCPTLLLGTKVYVGSFCLSNTLNFSFFPTSFWGSHAQIPSVPSLCKPLLRLFLIAFERKSRQAREKKSVKQLPTHSDLFLRIPFGNPIITVAIVFSIIFCPLF